MTRLKKIFFCSGIYSFIYVIISWTCIIKGLHIFRNCDYVCLADILCYVEYYGKALIIPVIGILFIIIQKDEFRSAIFIRHMRRIAIVVDFIKRNVLFSFIIGIISMIINILIGIIYVPVNMTWTIDKSVPHIMIGSPMKEQPETWIVIAYFTLNIIITVFFTAAFIMLVWWIVEKAYIGYILTIINVLLISMSDNSVIKYLFYARVNMKPELVYIQGLDWYSLFGGILEIILFVVLSCIVIKKKDFIRIY